MKQSFLLLLFLTLISCKEQVITKEQFEVYAKEHGYIIMGGDTTTNSKVLNILKNKKFIKPDIEAQFIRHEIDSVSYHNLFRLFTAAYPNTATEDIALMVKMTYLHGPIALIDPTTIYINPQIPFFLNTTMGNPMEFTLSLLQVEFDPYMDGWQLAKECNIPYHEMYFSKLADGVYELVVPF